MPAPPPWRRAFDRAERAVGAPLERMIDTRRFASALVIAFRIQGVAYGLMERQTRAVLHLLNIPARTDIKRLNRQVAVLANEVRRLSEHIEADGARPSPGTPTATGPLARTAATRSGSSRSGSSRRRPSGTSEARKRAGDA